MDIDVPEGKPFGQQYRYRYIHVEAKFAVLRDVPLGGNNIGEMQTGGFPPDGDLHSQMQQGKDGKFTSTIDPVATPTGVI